MKKIYAFVVMACLLGQYMLAQNQNLESTIGEYLNDSTTRSSLTTQDVSEWQITDVVPSLNPSIKHVYVQQMYQGIPIQNGTYKLTVKNGQVSWEINQFINEIGSRANATQASLTPENAIMAVIGKHKMATPSNLSRAAIGLNKYAYSNSGISPEPIQVEQVYYHENGSLYLTWKVSVYQNDGQHWWSDNVDAMTGQVIRSEDWVVSCNFGDAHETHSHDANIYEAAMGPVTLAAYEASTAAALVGGGSYNVYPLGIESPSHGNRAIVNDPAVASASPFGWHDTNGSSGAEFTITRGNNVWAQDDINGNNGTGSSPNGGSSLNFNFPLNLNNTPSTFLNAATTNLFYWNNIMHDVWYQYGFDEASGNFQENNYGNGGAGSDSVFADAQDGSGTNNANFGTPPDGQNPRMQMFLWTNPTRDGDFDNVVIAHEYGHGISTRLVGGPGTNALGGSEQMGEGWSDWFGLVMTIRPGDTRTTPRGVGTYVLGQPTNGLGIRPTRYSTDFAENGTTYSDLPSLVVPHGVGYGFATILWDMTWDLIDQEGFDSDQYNGNGGNNIAMALVTEGLKNTANNPGYVSGRDGILQADQDLYGGQYNCLIWDAFARRGVGVDAVENTNGGTNTNSDQSVSFVSGCSGPPPPASCNSTVSSFPYAESFENTLGGWSQDASNDFDWTVNSGGTPSNSTGPSGAIDGNFYVYVEASSPNFGGLTTILNSPCFVLPNGGSPETTFSYQMTGNAVGTIRLEARVDGSNTWSEIWSLSGDQGAAWQDAVVDLSSFAGDTVQLRYRATTGTSWQGDIAIDGFEITTTTVDTEAPSAPTNLNATAIAETTVDLAWNASTDNVGVTGYEVFLDGNALGVVTATNAQVTGLVAATDYAFTVRAQDAAGNNSGLSNTLNVRTTGGSCVGGVGVPYNESFEANIGLWTQASSDDLNWTRDANGTPSNNTGPSSGSNGSFYMYVEASGNGTGFPNKRAILNSPCFDLSGQTEASFIFDYHMFGSTDSGRVDLEVSTDDGGSWTSIWNQTGDQGNQWNTVTINLAAYLGGGIQLRFNRVTGGTWRSDVAIDNTRLVAGGGVPTNEVLIGSFFETGLDGWLDGGSDCFRYSGEFSAEGSFSMRLRDNSGVPSSMTTDATYDLTSYNNVEVTFTFYPNSMENGEDFWVRYDDGSGFQTVAAFASGSDFTNGSFFSATVNIPSSQYNLTSNGRFRIQCDASANQDQVYIDEVIITGMTGSSFDLENSVVELGPGSQGFAGGSFGSPTFEGDFSILPNPAVSFADINLEIDIEDEAIDVNLAVIDVNGRMILNKDYNNTSNELFNERLDVSALRSGVYFVHITSSNGMQEIQKLIKK